jgi:hypothetical protein
MALSPARLEQLKKNKDKLPPEVRAKLGSLLEERTDLEATAEAQDNFMSFVNYVWPNFIPLKG